MQSHHGYMDHILEWVLLHRSAEERPELFGQSRFGATPVRPPWSVRVLILRILPEA